MKKPLLCLLGLVLGVCSAVASMPYEVTAKTSLNVRSSASSQGAVIGKLYSGERIEVVSVTGSWAEISYKGRTAYVSSRYITPLSDTQSRRSEEPKERNHIEKDESDMDTDVDVENQSTAPMREYPSEGNYRIDTNNEVVTHYMFYGAQYDLLTFKSAKSSLYGVFWSISSLSHWGRFHVGADLSMRINAGIIDDWGYGCDFGPSVRVDITDNVFVNMPVNARMAKVWNNYDVNSGESVDEHKDSRTSWGAVIKPSIYFFPAPKFGLFIGPQLNISDGCDIGMQAGIALEL